MNRPTARLLAILLLLAASPDAAAGQGNKPSDAASPLLPAGHPSLAAARRLQAAGLLSAALPPRSATGVREMAWLLRSAASEAAERGSPLATLAAGWAARFAEEFRLPAGEGPALVHAAALLGGAAADGRVAPGLGEYPPGRTGPLPREDLRTAVAGVELQAVAGRHLSLAAAPTIDADGFGLLRGEAHGRWGAWGLSVGRMPVAYGYAASGSPVLSTTLLDRAQLATERPVRVPLLGFLGPVTAHTFLATMDEDRHPGGTLLWGASAAVHPHPRVALEVHRAALIGGDSVTDPITGLALLQGLVGKHAGVENQIVSVEGRWRLPSEGWLPLTVFCEVGSEDSSGSFYRVPGVVCGGFAPVLPGAPALSAGIEGSLFGGRCCGNPGWYRHRLFPGSWATADAPLGHPLGGEGTEARVFLGIDALAGRLGGEISGFRRDRGEENLFVPGRDGASLGAAAALRLRFGARGEVEVATTLEDGSGWSERRVQLLSRAFF